jgi:ADP-ribose pyrophosphatase
MAKQIYTEYPQAVETGRTAAREKGFLKIDIFNVTVGRFDGGSMDVIREVMQRGDAVDILAYDPHKDAVILGREFRIGVHANGEQPYTLALPAGGLAKGEAVIDAAQRELDEESGLVLAQPRIAYSSLYPSEGGCSERVSLIFGLVSAPDKQAVLGLASEKECILRYTVPFKQFWAMTKPGCRDMVSLRTNFAAHWLKLNRPAIRRELGITRTSRPQP